MNPVIRDLLVLGVLAAWVTVFTVALCVVADAKARS